MSIMLLAWLLPDVLAAVLLLLAAHEKRVLGSRLIAEATAGLLIAASPFVFTTPFTPVTKIVLVVLQLFLLLLPARILFGRLPKPFAYGSTQLNVALIIALLVLVIIGWWLGNTYNLLGGYEWRLRLLMALALAAQCVFLAQYIWTVRHYRLGKSMPLARKDLPTVSVCVPARNETHALEDCLVSVLASSYPKLEVLVLDDCSQDKTSQIIRSFAHDGVRFIQGEAPAEGWLGKNQAMQNLAEQANGDFILFMDVDTRLSVQSITQLVEYAVAGSQAMVAVLPQNRLGMQPGALFDTLGYFWQVVLPITRHRIPVAGQCWLIKADALKQLGGFKSVAHKIVPEGSFAKRLAANDQYRFITSTRALGITTAKRWPSQLESSVRIMYPTYKRQPLFALGALLFVGATMVAPLALSVWLLVQATYGSLLIFSAAAAVLGFVNFVLVLGRTHPRSWWLAMWFLPVVGVQEMILIVVSMLQYEFGDVNWKGRNVCYPVILQGQRRQTPVAPGDGPAPTRG